jgi:hypothetical protein
MGSTSISPLANAFGSQPSKEYTHKRTGQARYLGKGLLRESAFSGPMGTRFSFLPLLGQREQEIHQNVKICGATPRFGPSGKDGATRADGDFG